MNRNFVALLQATLLMAPGLAMAAPLPESILEQLPEGYSVLSHQSGELDDDELTDFIVAIRRIDEKSIGTTSPAPARPLLLFIQRSDGGYSLVHRNDHVVFRADEGGQCDPFEEGAEGLVINKRYFTVQNGVACGEHWSDYITFRYVAALRDWIFHKRIFESWVMNDGTDPDAEALVPGARRVVTGKGKPPLRFENYRTH